MKYPYKFKNTIDQSQLATQINLAFSYAKLNINNSLLWTVAALRKTVCFLRSFQVLGNILFIATTLYFGMPCEWGTPEVTSASLVVLSNISETAPNKEESFNKFVAALSLTKQPATDLGIINNFAAGLDAKAPLVAKIQIGLDKTISGLNKLNTGLTSSNLSNNIGWSTSAKAIAGVNKVVHFSTTVLGSFQLKAPQMSGSDEAHTNDSASREKADANKESSHLGCLLCGVLALSILILLNLIKPITQMLAFRAVLSTNKETDPCIPISSRALESIESDIRCCKLEAALKSIEQELSVPNRKIRKEIVLLHYRLNDLRHKQHTNVVNYDYISIQKNQIAAAIYDLLNIFKQASLEVS